MNCYRCNGKLDLTRNTCPKCGTDVRFFKKIVYASNRCYNEGLYRAQAKDLTGARDSLRTSLSLYKNNTQARNLLGLVYYAMGESAEALKQWVISKNLESSQNPADRYISAMRRNMHDLDSEDHGIKKYNQALAYAKSGATDLATIQLKKVVSVHSNMTKAYELLALLYMQDKKYAQATKVLNRCLQVDRGNVSAIRYLKEIEALSEPEIQSAGVVGDEDREQLIIPVRFRDYGTYLTNALYILLGAVLGIAIAWFVVVPGKVEYSLQDASRSAQSYENRISDLQGEILQFSLDESEVARQESVKASESIAESIRESESASEAAKNDAETLPTVDGYDRWVQNNENVGLCATYNGAFRYAQAIDVFIRIDKNNLNDFYRDTYLALAEAFMNPYNLGIYTAEAAALESEGSYADAAFYYKTLALLFKHRADLRYHAGLCYEKNGETELAANYYWQVVNLFPGDENASDSRARYTALKGVSEVPGLPEGTDKEAETREPSYEDFLPDGQ